VHRHSASWESTKQALTEAKAALPAVADTEPLELFDDYLAHNELGLAFGVLAFVAGEAEAEEPCWQALLSAVHEMGLREDDDLYGRAVQRVIRRTTAQE
jgi:hypothetical protein